MIKILIKYIIIINIFLFSNYSFSYENRIIFKIANKTFTSIDLNNRKKYLIFVGDNNNLDENLILEDYISVNIFNASRQDRLLLLWLIFYDFISLYYIQNEACWIR